MVGLESQPEPLGKAKDGEAWETWQLTDPSSAATTDNGAAAALQTLQALADRTMAENRASPALDISV